MSGLTLAEKVLARAAGRLVRAGDDVKARPDFVLAYDLPGYTDAYAKAMAEDLGVARVPAPERFTIFIDHMAPATNAKEEAFHQETRRWGAEQGVRVVERRGIGHQVAAEMGLAAPGAFVVHFDGHVSQLGAFGALAIGLRRNLLEAFVRERVSLSVPATTRLDLHGTLAPGVMARDLFHHLVARLGNQSCRFQVLELGGPGIDGLSTDGLQTVTGLAMFLGATTSVVDPAPGPRTEAAIAAGASRFPLARSDDDAVFAARHAIDLSEVEPVIVLPPSPANTRPLVDHLGLHLDVGYLGSCASGRLEDLRAAARVLRGRRVADGFQLNVVPTSQAIWQAAAREGLLETLAEAGAFISGPTCDWCYGHAGAMSAGMRAVSTGTLNVRGRMGSPDAEIVLASAATVAASAIEGKLADPRAYL